MKYLVAIVFIFISCLQINGQLQKNFLDVNYIEVSGFAEKEYDPDIAYLSIYIGEEDYKDKESLESKENEMIALLNQQGLDVEEDLRINNLKSGFQKYFLKGQKVIKSRNYELKVSDISKLSALMVGLERLHISNVNLSRVEYSKIDEAKLEIKVAAMKNSFEKANALTTAINQKVGKAIHILDNSQPYVPHRAQDNMMYAKSKAESIEMDYAPLQIQAIKISANVYVKYLLE